MSYNKPQKTCCILVVCIKRSEEEVKIKDISKTNKIEINGQRIHLQLLIVNPFGVSDLTEGREEKNYGK